MREITYRDALREALIEEMQRDETVFLLGEDIGRCWEGAFKVTKGLAEKFGDERVRDTPISESAIVGAAVGAAITGMRPIAEIMFGDLITLAMDQIANQAAKIRYMFGGQVKVPLIVRTPFGGGVNIAAHHSQSLEAWFMHIPGLLVALPSTPYDAKGLLKAAIRGDDPVMFIEHATLYQTKGEVPENDYVEPIGVSKVQRAGRDVTIVAYSKMLQSALQAADQLAGEGIEAEVVDLRSLRPLDMDPILESFRRTNRAVIVEEGWRSFGVGAEVAARIYEEAFDYADAPIKRVAQKEVPLPYNRKLEQMALPQIDDILTGVREVL